MKKSALFEEKYLGNEILLIQGIMEHHFGASRVFIDILNPFRFFNLESCIVNTEKIFPDIYFKNHIKLNSYHLVSLDDLHCQ